MTKGYLYLQMTPLRKAYCAQRLLRSSPHLCLRSSPVHKEKECESSNCVKKPVLPESGISGSNSEGQNISPVNEGALKESESTSPESELVLPEEPTTCCMSGCANCVWIEYADQLCKVLKDREKAREVILSKVSDPNLRAFLLMELKNLENNNGDRTS